MEMVGAWAERALNTVERWPDDPALADVDSGRLRCGAPRRRRRGGAPAPLRRRAR
jgi:hypothetical protein